jgi:rsbT co-antagonist protein RsbR
VLDVMNVNEEMLQDEITALNQHIAELEEVIENLRPYQSLFDHLPVPMALFHADGTVMNINNAMESLLDISRGSVIGSYNVLENGEAVEAGHAGCFMQARAGTVAHMQPVPYNLQRAGHETSTRDDTVWTEPLYFPLYDETDEIRYIAALNHDATRRLQAEQEVYKLNAELEQRIAERTAQLEEQSAALRTSQALLQGILDHSPAVMYVKDTDGRYMIVNRNWSTVLGKDGDEVVGKTDDELFPPAISAGFSVNDHQVIASGTPMQIEEVAPHADGMHTYISVKFPLLDETGSIFGVGGISTDITERKRMEDEMQMARFTLLNLADGIHWLNHESRQVYVNNTVCDMLGYTHEEMLTMTVADIDPNFPPEAWDATWEDVRQHGTKTFETAHRHRDGTIIPVEVTASYLEFKGEAYICSSIRNISERKRTEEALRTFKTVIETSPDAIGVADMNGTITYANPAFKAMSGYSDGLVGQSFITLYPEETHAAVAASAQHVVQHGSWQGELTMNHVEGGTTPVHLTSFVITDAQGNPTAMTGMFRDLTEQQRQERERAELQRQIIEAQQASIRELSTPLLPLANHVLAMPLVGSIDSNRAQQIMETLLEGIAAHTARIAIIDITGVMVVDTQVAQALVRTAQAVRLLGAQVVLTGIQPPIAQTLVHLGADLRGIITRSTLQSGIEWAMQASNASRTAKAASAPSLAGAGAKNGASSAPLPRKAAR